MQDLAGLLSFVVALYLWHMHAHIPATEFRRIAKTNAGTNASGRSVCGCDVHRTIRNRQMKGKWNFAHTHWKHHNCVKREVGQ